MSIRISNRPARLAVNSLRNQPLETLQNTEPFDNIDKPDWVASSGVSRGILILLGVMYTLVALVVLRLSFIGASFKYGVPIGIVVGLFTIMAIVMVWYVILNHRTISRVWKIGILIFEVLVMGFDVYVSAAGWNLREVTTYAENKAVERKEDYAEFYNTAKAVYGGVSSVQQQAGSIAEQERVQNGGKGKIFRIASTVNEMLGRVKFERPLISPKPPTFEGKLTLKDLNTALTQYHDLFNAEETQIRSELQNTVKVLEAQVTLANQEADLNEFQTRSVAYLNELINAQVNEAKEVVEKKIPLPQMTDQELNEASRDGVMMRMLAAAGLLFFLGLISILTWPRSRTRGGARDPYSWYERMLVQHHVESLHLPLGYSDEELEEVQFGSLDDDLIGLISSDIAMRTRVETSGLTYRDLRDLYQELGRASFTKVFSASGWTPQQISDLLRDTDYASLARPIIQKLSYAQFVDVKTFRPDGGVADVISRSEVVTRYYLEMIARTKNKMINRAERSAFIDRFISAGHEDDEFYQKVLHCVNVFNAAQLNVLSVEFVDNLLSAVLTEVVSLFDTVDPSVFELYQSQWTVQDSHIIQQLVDRNVFTTLAGLVENWLRVSPRLWQDFKREWQQVTRLTARGATIPIDSEVVRTLSRVIDETSIRSGLLHLFTIAPGA